MVALWHSGEDVLSLRQDSPHIRLMFPASCSRILDSAGPLLPVHCRNSQRNLWKRTPQPGRRPYRCFTTLAPSLIDGHYTKPVDLRHRIMTTAPILHLVYASAGASKLLIRQNESKDAQVCGY
jgi:hypothetical protein